MDYRYASAVCVIYNHKTYEQSAMGIMGKHQSLTGIDVSRLNKTNLSLQVHRPHAGLKLV